MSPSLKNPESEWRAQYAAMRQALTTVSTDELGVESKSYGHDIVLEDEDLTGSGGSDDLWDIFSDDEQDTDSSYSRFTRDKYAIWAFVQKASCSLFALQLWPVHVLVQQNCCRTNKARSETRC